jgi:hypothetical protein
MKKEVIRTKKNGKCSGIDAICSKLVKYGGEIYKQQS